jgi:hypothetical protein
MEIYTKVSKMSSQQKSLRAFFFLLSKLTGQRWFAVSCGYTHLLARGPAGRLRCTGKEVSFAEHEQKK